ncbi:MAG: hypothetical protein HQL05_07410 [Nitrospirae bacterium]|uniref:hypothetical protein n=1 Tax=Candidatus Magnetobacterium casense TaxID=1455061 RepID=UPI00058B9349|nr:hypothetical protein [Candidatus Magnetobacterium casensis]MBF0337647.1 hypothetical protein [Nitrospirota bacterium]
MQMLLESRVDRLEIAMAELIELHRVAKIEAEEREQRQEERDRRQEERDRRMEESDRKNKEEHEAFRLKMAAMEREARQQRAEIAKQLGTLVEDIIAPGTVALIKQYFNCDPDSFCLRYKKRIGGSNCEVDIMLTCQDRVFVIEVKSKPDERDVMKILAKTKTLPTFFDECTGRQVIPMLASVVVEDEIIKFATIEGLYVVAYRQWEYLDILNFNEVKTS